MSTSTIMISTLKLNMISAIGFMGWVIIPGHDLSEADVVRLIYSLILKERYSLQRVASYLNKHHIPSQAQALIGTKHYRPDVAWNRVRVHRIATNEVYTGRRIYQTKTEAIESTVPALVSREEWEQVGIQLKKRNGRSVRNIKYESLLRGLIRCGTCNRVYIYKLHDRSRLNLRYYTCSAKSEAKMDLDGVVKRCPSVMVRADWLEERIWNTIVEYCQNPRDAVEKMRAQSLTEQRNAGLTRSRIARVHQQLQAKRGERDHVIGLSRRALITEADLIRQMDIITSEEERLRGDLEELETQLAVEEDSERVFNTAEMTLIKLRREIHKPLSFEQRQGIIRCTTNLRG